MRHQKTMTNKKSSFKNVVKTIAFISIALTIIKLAIIGKIELGTVAVLLVLALIILALNKKILFAILTIISFYLFIKLKTNSPQEEQLVIIALIAIAIVLFIIYRMVKRLFS
ncbi:MAG: hypothetical protein JJE44_02085 [Flavobacteriaceae bacterium]|nr:hypothetical protein [Flavobacteriaceae bacterium]